MGTNSAKIEWQGRVLGVQPRIRLMRSFDQRSHSYLGYVVRLEGTLGEVAGTFHVAIGPAAQVKHELRSGDSLIGAGVRVADPSLETADLYKISGLRVAARGPAVAADPPPFGGAPPDLPAYRSRGHRRLATRTYTGRCTSCIWGCEMPVEIIIDQWKPERKRYRRETFCYGPKSCRVYAAGPTRKVSGRRGMSWEEEDWIDEESTAHRGPDE